MKHVKLFERFINDEAAASSINEASDSSIKPNSKLKSATGYPYAMFYFSTGIDWGKRRAISDGIMVNFEDAGHVSLIKLLADQDRERRNDGSLSKSSVSKGENLFKKVLGHNIVYSTYDGAACSFRLSSTPSVDLSDGKKEWLSATKPFSPFAGSGPFKSTEAIEMEKYI